MKKRWRVICVADGIEEEFATMDEALKEADDVLSVWRDHAHNDGEWGKEVEGVEIHLVTHAARITNREGDNEDNGVDYGITEMPMSEIEKDAVGGADGLLVEVAKLCNIICNSAPTTPIAGEIESLAFFIVHHPLLLGRV